MNPIAHKPLSPRELGRILTRVGFLLSKFLMDALAQQVTVRDINNLRNLPSNMNDIYDSVFNRISNRKLAYILKKLLIVVAMAREILSLEVLAYAITIEPGDDDVDELTLPDVEYLVSICAGLVVIDSSEHVRPAHRTVGNTLR